MKKQLAILVAIVIVLACSSVAIVRSNDRKAQATVTTTSQVKSLQAQLARVQAVQTLHDQTNTTAIKNAGDQIITLTQQKATLCTQIKGAKLTQPLCL